MKAQNSNQEQPEVDEDEIYFDDIPPYPNNVNDLDEQRRAFIIDCMADPEIDGRILVQNMDAVYKWLKKTV